MYRYTLLFFLFFAACGLNTNNVEQKFNTPLTSGCREAAVQDQFVVRWKDGSTSVEHSPSREEFIKNFLTDHKDKVEFAEHDYVIRLEPALDSTVDEMLLDPEDWGQKDSEANWAWENGLSGQDVIVAVVDSGADLTHPQLINQAYKNNSEIPDGIDNDENGLVDDVSGWDFVNWSPVSKGDTFHGTHVSGIALADHSAGTMKGMAPAAKLLPLKFIDTNSGYLSDAIMAIDYAVNIAKREDKPLVVNASWGGGDCSMALRKKMDEFNTRRVLFAVAAGNDGRNISSYPVYPAAYGLTAQITVAAHSARNVLTTFSNYGIRVDLSAPGKDIFSLAPDGNYAREQGTSMATPFVSGAAALLWGYRPTATTAQIRQALFDGVETGPFNVRLRGKLNVRKAKLALDKM